MKQSYLVANQEQVKKAADGISRGLVWDHSPEGHLFWSLVDQRLGQLVNHPEKEYESILVLYNKEMAKRAKIDLDERGNAIPKPPKPAPAPEEQEEVEEDFWEGPDAEQARPVPPKFGLHPGPQEAAFLDDGIVVGRVPELIVAEGAEPVVLRMEE